VISCQSAFEIILEGLSNGYPARHVNRRSVAVLPVGHYTLPHQGSIAMRTTPHHVGCAVKEMESSSATYVDALGLHKITRSFEVAKQGVSVCFLELAPCFYLELVTPLATA
jgi:hypothetical protein